MYVRVSPIAGCAPVPSSQVSTELREVGDEKEGMCASYCRRGIPAQPLLNGYCGNYEAGMARSMINDPIFNYDNADSSNSSTTPSDLTTARSTTPRSASSSLFNQGWLHLLSIASTLGIIHRMA